jgi:uncharacterized protein YoxC
MASTTVERTRTALKQIAQQIENLAKQVQSKLASGADILSTANELVRNSSTFVFSLGQLHAQDKKRQATIVSNPNGTATPTWHNHRDSLGRFAKR